jgi:hypothetical protein
VTTCLASQESQAACQAALEAEKARNVVFIDDLPAVMNIEQGRVASTKPKAAMIPASDHQTKET